MLGSIIDDPCIPLDNCHLLSCNRWNKWPQGRQRNNQEFRLPLLIDIIMIII